MIIVHTSLILQIPYLERYVSMDNYADYKIAYFSAQELCEGQDGHPGLPVPNKPDGFVDVKQQ